MSMRWQRSSGAARPGDSGDSAQHTLCSFRPALFERRPYCERGGPELAVQSDAASQIVVDGAEVYPSELLGGFRTNTS